MATWSILVAALLVAFGYPWVAAIGDRRRFAPPGRLVRVNGHRLHVLIQGHGSPTVVLESGLPGTVLSWSLVQDRLAAHTRVVSYDRAGLGWSDPGPLPRTASQIVEELRGLLRAAAVAPPYLLVGHSYGGLTVRLFAARYPDEVMGLMLLDPTMPEEWFPGTAQTRALLAAGARLCRRGAWVCRLGLARWLALWLRVGKAGGGLTALRWLSKGFLADAARVVGPVFILPAERRAIVHSFWQQAKFYQALASQIETLPESARQVLEADRGWSKPLRIISTTETDSLRRQAQLALAQRCPAGQWQMAPTGHWIQLEAPHWVATTILELLDRAPPVASPPRP